MKKSVFICAVVLAISFLLSGCGGSSAGPVETDVHEQTFDLEEYKASVSSCREDINSASLILANIGSYENNFWKALGSLSDDIVDSAFVWLSDNSEESQETVIAANDGINEAYKMIVLEDIDGNEAKEIDVAFRNLYDAYSDMYDLVLNPSGDRASFAKKLSGLIDSVSDSDSDLALFLD